MGIVSAARYGSTDGRRFSVKCSLSPRYCAWEKRKSPPQLRTAAGIHRLAAGLGAKIARSASPSKSEGLPTARADLFLFVRIVVRQAGHFWLEQQQRGGASDRARAAPPLLSSSMSGRFVASFSRCRSVGSFNHPEIGATFRTTVNPQVIIPRHTLRADSLSIHVAGQASWSCVGVQSPGSPTHIKLRARNASRPHASLGSNWTCLELLAAESCPGTERRSRRH